MAGIIAKRASLHRAVASQMEQNHLLKSQMTQIQPLASIGLLSSMIAHELNNILTPLANYAQLSLDHPEDAALREKALRKTVLNCERACKIQQSLLALANGQRQKKESADFRALINEVFACLCRDFRKEKIEIVTDIPGNLVIPMVPAQIQQVIMNLILNARDALLPAGGTITIKACRSEDSAVITVSDTGKGIEQAVLAHIFEAFFTTKAGQDIPTAGSGSGLGLAFCREIVELHNGAISVQSQLGQGTTFKIILPL